MIVERLVFRTKYGKADYLVALLQKTRTVLPDSPYTKGRILTDLTGGMFTVVWEREWRSLQAWQRGLKETFSDPQFAQWFKEMEKMVETGSREFYTVQ